MSGLQNYLLSVSAAALLMSLLLALLPSGHVKQTAKFTGALLVVLAVVAPVVKLNADDLARSIAMLQMEKEQLRTGVEVKNREILAELIKEQSEAYILDKAEELGLTLSVDITLREEGDYPYPIAVTLWGEAAEGDKMLLERIIEQDIGIVRERQEWKNSE